MAQIHIMHYLNQFFAGKGGEDKADTPLFFSEGPMGPGKRLQALLGASAKISFTAYCGDNYFVEHQAEVLEKILHFVEDREIRIAAGGPAFASGRYGFACEEICHFLSTLTNFQAVIGMHIENPGVDGYKQYKDRNVFILPASKSLSGSNMEDILSRMAQFILRLGSGVPIGPASVEGYIPRGFRLDEVERKNGVERAIDMLLDRIYGRPFSTEIPVESFDHIMFAPRIANLKKAHLALITTSGVVPQGNPDKFKVQRNTQWRKYSIDKLDSMKEAKWEVVHGGHNPSFINNNPNYSVPIDAFRELERSGVFAKLYPYFYGTTGAQALISAMVTIGKEIALDMKEQGVEGALLVAT